MKRILIVGSSGQDGQILFERLRREGHWVAGLDVGVVQCTAPADLGPVNILDAGAVENAVRRFSPQEIYYLAAYHHSSQDRPCGDRQLLEKSFAINVFGLVNFLEAVRLAGSGTRLFYAGSSHMFGAAPSPQDESTPFRPESAYGISKAAGVECVRLYRQTHGLFAAVGILYNHESPLRGARFVTQKIARAAAAIQAGREQTLTLGDLDAAVDWGYAPDYVDAMVRILSLPQPDDFVVASGQSHTVRAFVEIAFGLLGLDWKKHVQVVPGLIAKSPRDLVGKTDKLRAATGWKPTVSFTQLVALLVQAQRQ